MRYDKSGDGHYRITSAFIKSMRGSDPDAALYYMNRMLEGGEDPNFILRRIVIFASEDIGLADPMALVTATHAMQAFQQVGMPEGGLAMTQAVLHCATAPKSNAVISSYKAAQKLARDHGDLAVPKHIAGASGDVAAAMGWGQGYKYPHEYEGHYVREDYLPPTLAGTRLYTPSDQGYEATVRRRLERWRGAEEE